MRTPDGPWVLVAPTRRLPELAPLVELRAAERRVCVVERENPPAADEWPRLVPRDAAGVLLVGDRRRAPRRVTPLPFVPAADGTPVPVGWLPAHRDLSGFLAAVRRAARRTDPSPVAVLGQRSPRYQRLSHRLVHHLADVPSVLWGAERLTREDMCTALTGGIGPTVYLGHGRPSGWAAYRGLRAADLAPVSSCAVGSVLSMTCWTASRYGVGTSFSEQIVLNGAAASAIGAVRPVLHLDSMRIVLALARTLHEDAAAEVGTLLRGMLLDRAGHPVPEAASFRLIGDPLASLLGEPGATERARAVFAPAPDHSPDAGAALARGNGTEEIAS